MAALSVADLAKELDVDIVSELVHSDLSKVTGVSSKTQAAQIFAQAYTDIERHVGA